MAFAQLIDTLSRLSESFGLSLQGLVFIFSILLPVFISGSVIMHVLSTVDKVLYEAGQDLQGIAQNFEHPASDRYVSDQRPLPAEDFEPGEIEADSGKNPVSKLAAIMRGPGKKSTVPASGAEYEAFLLCNAGLKKELLDLIHDTQESVSLQDLLIQLPRHPLDGNYHPVLNELDRLEKEGQIEGWSINGKVFFRKIQREKQKFTIRKGRNFQKFSG